MAWLSSLMFSRGMSQVSAMISATLSNVLDIGHAHFWQQNGAVRGNGAEQARSLRAPPVMNARIAKDIVEFNAARGSRMSAVV
jgi:predicted CoA-binding protein